MGVVNARGPVNAASGVYTGGERLTVVYLAWNARPSAGLARMPSIDRHPGRSIMAQTRAPSRIVTLVSLNALGGAILGAACALLLLASDFVGLARLLSAGREPGVAIALLLGGFATTFAGLVAATAVMLIPEREGSPRNGGGRVRPIHVLVPVRANAPVRIRRQP